MNIDANSEKESPNVNKSIENGDLGERHSLIQVSDLKVDETNQDNNNGTSSGLQGANILQVQQQQQSQGSVVCWERFLHVRSIRVLLVENDDCTRHVVTALLRNCNYEVLDAANGMQAWKVLEDLNNHVDIVLTEVVMRCLSGIGLLNKIMSHKTRKHIPVIMMSSHDSMGLVFKCLSKGAVDFLVKPIRKNELKNLWQHVWRRCHSSSGSGSESGTQTQKSVKSKASEKSGNSASDDGEDDESNGLNVGNGSDDGSGAQSSWTKQAVEVDSSQALLPMDQAAECPDSTCAQVIRSNVELSDNKKIQLIVAREGHGEKQPDTGEKGHDLQPVVHRAVEPKSENHDGQLNANSRESESARDVANKLDIKNNATDDFIEPNVELSLKRLRGVQDSGRSVQDDRYVLRRSEQSAFSRYNTTTNIFKPPNGITGSSSILGTSIEVAKKELGGDIQVYSADNIVYRNSNGVSNIIDMGSSTDKRSKDKSEATSAINGLHPSAFRPVKIDFRYNQVSLLPSTNAIGGPTDGNPRDCSLNRSASGSNHGSNGQNGSSTAANAVGNNNSESDVGQGGKSGSREASGSGTGNRVDENKFAQREAALIKFRQKRKERCFKKKVRYQNRKKLAEQRPRVRGQFVMQTETDSSNRSADE